MGIVAAAIDRLCESRRGEAGKVLGRIADALEELRDDGAGVSPRAIEQDVREVGQEFAKTVAAGFGEHVQHCAQRDAQVGAGVTVRNREDIDAVEHLLLVLDPVDSRHEPRRQLLGVKRETCSLTGSQKGPLIRETTGSGCRGNRARRRPA